MQKRNKAKPGQEHTRYLAKRAQAHEPEEERIEQISRQAHLFGAPTRLRIALAIFNASEPALHVGAIQRATGFRQPIVSHHLGLLQSGNVINRRRDGRRIYYSLHDSARSLLGFLVSMTEPQQRT